MSEVYIDPSLTNANIYRNLSNSPPPPPGGKIFVQINGFLFVEESCIDLSNNNTRKRILFSRV